MKRVAPTFLWLSLWLGSFAITLSSIVYFNTHELAPFVIEKLPLPALDGYVWALRIHVLAAALALPGCILLSSKRLLKRWPSFHRWGGRWIGIIVLVALVPSGFYLSFFARGGWGATVGFILSGIIVLVAMVQGVRSARAKQYDRHRRYVLHVLGQLSVAVSSRAMLYMLESTSLDQNLSYILSLWIPVLATFGLVEYFVSPTRFKLIPRSLYEKMVLYFGFLRGRSSSYR